MKQFSSVNTIIDIAEFQANTQPEKTAFSILGDGENISHNISFGELAWFARSFAVRLQQENFSGQVALLIYPTSIEFIIAFLGCLYAGIIAVPAYPPDPMRIDRPLKRLKTIIHDSKPTICMTSVELQNILQSLLNKKELPSMNWISTDSIDTVSGNTWKYPEINKDSIAYLQYTSGSTQRPRGVTISHQQTLANLELGKKLNNFSKESRIVGWVPLYHDLGLIAYVIGTLYNGCHCYLMSPHHFLQKPFRWLQAISQFRGTHNAAPPFGYELCVKKTNPDNRKTLDLSCWTVAGIGAEKVYRQTIERFSTVFQDAGFNQQSFFPTYGMAEAVLYISGGKSPSYASPMVNPVEDKNSQLITGCGNTDENHRIIIVDLVSKKQCKQGTTGEIWVKGPGVANGYYRKTQETRETFQAFLSDTGEGPFLRTGDLGFIHNNNLFVSGRLKDLIIVKGQNYYPEDIEFSLKNIHSQLKPGSIAAFSVEESDGEKTIIVCEIKPDTQKDHYKYITLSIKDHVLNIYGILPDKIILIPSGSLSKTSSGKVQRQYCKHLFQSKQLCIDYQWESSGQSTEISMTPLSDQLDHSQNLFEGIYQQVVIQVKEMASIPEQDIHEKMTFQELGLDSFGFSQLINNIETVFGVKIQSDIINSEIKLEEVSRYIGEKLCC